jgi:hypothetical protein
VKIGGGPRNVEVRPSLGSGRYSFGVYVDGQRMISGLDRSVAEELQARQERRLANLRTTSNLVLAADAEDIIRRATTQAKNTDELPEVTVAKKRSNDADAPENWEIRVNGETVADGVDLAGAEREAQLLENVFETELQGRSAEELDAFMNVAVDTLVNPEPPQYLSDPMLRSVRFEGLPDVDGVTLSLDHLDKESDIEIRQAINDAFDTYPDIRGFLASVGGYHEAPRDVQQMRLMNELFSDGDGPSMFGTARFEPENDRVATWVNDEPEIADAYAASAEEGRLSKAADTTYGRFMHELGHVVHYQDYGAGEPGERDDEAILERQTAWVRDWTRAMLGSGLMQFSNEETGETRDYRGEDLTDDEITLILDEFADSGFMVDTEQMERVTWYGSDPFEFYAEVFTSLNTPGALEKYPEDVQEMLRDARDRMNRLRGKKVM